MKYNSKLILFSVIGLLFSGFIYLNGSEEELLDIKFTAVAWNETIRGLYYFDSGQPVPIIIANGAPGEIRSYYGPSPLTFYTRLAGEDGEYDYQPKATVSLENSQRKLFLVFFQNTPDSPIRIFPIPDSEEDFGAGDFHFNNFTSKDVLLRVGEDRFSLSPGDFRVVNISEGNAQNVEVQIASTDEENNWRLVYQSRWGPPGNRRVWVFLHGEETRPSIRRFTEYLN